MMTGNIRRGWIVFGLAALIALGLTGAVVSDSVLASAGEAAVPGVERGPGNMGGWHRGGMMAPHSWQSDTVTGTTSYGYGPGMMHGYWWLQPEDSEDSGFGYGPGMMFGGQHGGMMAPYGWRTETVTGTVPYGFGPGMMHGFWWPQPGESDEDESGFGYGPGMMFGWHHGGMMGGMMFGPHMWATPESDETAGPFPYGFGHGWMPHGGTCPGMAAWNAEQTEE